MTADALRMSRTVVRAGNAGHLAIWDRYGAGRRGRRGSRTKDSSKASGKLQHSPEQKGAINNFALGGVALPDPWTLMASPPIAIEHLDMLQFLHNCRRILLSVYDSRLRCALFANAVPLFCGRRP
jgi:hypothetical protein